MYGHNTGTNVLTTTENKTALTGQDGIYASSVYDSGKNEIILKIANTSDSEKSVTYHLKGLKTAERKVTKTVLKSTKPDAENTLDKPETVVPASEEINIPGSDFELKLAPKAFYLLNIKL